MQGICYLRPLPTLTLEAQQRAFLDYCSSAALEVGPTFSELRPDSQAEFRRMLSLLGGEQRAFEVVVVASLAVLGATAREQARRYLQLAAVGMPLTLADGTDADQAVLAAWGHRSASERRRDQVRQGMRERALRGEVLGRAPYGYRVVARRLQVHPEEAAVVREIFRRYLEEGEGVRRIARALNDAGLRTRRGTPWSMVSIREALRNPVYIGTYRRLGVVVPTDHPPLVTRDQFHEVQRRLAARRTSFGPQHRGEYLLAGLATCGYCGNRLIGVRRTVRTRASGGAPQVRRYYQCESRTNHSRCDYHTRRADDLESDVRARLRRAEPREHVASAAPANGAEDVARLDSRRLGLRRQLDALIERRISGEWSAERLRQEAAPVALADLAAEEQAEAARSRQERLARGSAREGSLASKRRRLVREWDRLPFEEQRSLLREAVAAVVVTDDAVDVSPNL